MQKFINTYHAKYHEWPAAWSILGYTAVQTWEQGVKKAHSFNANKVSAALSGDTVHTIRGPIELRACDHQGNVGEFVGKVSAKVDAKYGYQIYHDTKLVPASQLMLTCKQAKALQPKA